MDKLNSRSCALHALLRLHFNDLNFMKGKVMQNLCPSKFAYTLYPHMDLFVCPVQSIVGYHPCQI